MYLLHKLFHIFSGKSIPLLKDFRFQLVNTQSLVFKKSKWTTAVLLLGIGFLGISCSNTNPNESLTQVEDLEPQATSNQNEIASNSIPAKYVVTIKDMKYNPAVIQAHIGDTVLFINKDLVPHNVADSLTKEWLSPQLDFGTEWPMVVTKDLHYYCAFHPNMEGDIQVGTPLSAQKSK